MGLIKGEPDTNIDAPRTSWWWPAALLMVAFLLLLGGDTVRDLLRYERAAISDGEIWRLVTGHLVHLGWSHLALDGIGLVLVWYLVGGAFRAADWAFVIMIAVGVIDLGFWFVIPELQWYVGLSGLLHGILAAGIVVSFQRPRIETLALAFLLLAKLGWEYVYGPLPGSESGAGGPVVVAAHLYGAIGGCLAGMAGLLIRVGTAPRI